MTAAPHSVTDGAEREHIEAVGGFHALPVGRTGRCVGGPGPLVPTHASGREVRALLLDGTLKLDARGVHFRLAR